MTGSGRTLLLAAAMALALALPSGYVDGIDAGTRLLETRAILFEGTTRIPAEWVRPEMGLTPSPLHPAADGTFRSPYGVGLPLVWLPFVAAGWVAHRVLGVSLEVASGAAISYVNVFVVAGILVVTWRLQARCGFSPSERRISAAALFIGTNLLSFVNTCFSEPLAALLVLGAFGLLALAEEWRAAVTAGALLAGATLVKPELTLLLLPALLLLREKKRPTSLAFLAAAAVGPAFIALSNWIVRGSPLRFEYLPRAYTTVSPLTGAIGTLFGETSLLVFDAALLVAVIGWLAPDVPSPLGRLRMPLLLTWTLLFVLYAGRQTGPAG